MDAFLGEIRLFPYSSLQPMNWMLCDGRTLLINNNQALYAVFGNTYGGNASQGTFQLPNLLGSTVMGQGQGPGLTNRVVGTAVGEVSVTLMQSTMAPHTHQLRGFDNNATVALTAGPAANGWFVYPQTATDASNAYSDNLQGNVTLAPTDIAPAAAAAQPHENRQPFLQFGYYMCISDGVFPKKP